MRNSESRTCDSRASQRPVFRRSGTAVSNSEDAVFRNNIRSGAAAICVALVSGASACSGGAGMDVDVVVAFQVGGQGEDQSLHDEWDSFRGKFAGSAHVVVTGGDFAPVYQPVKIPSDLPDIVDAGAARDGGQLHGIEGYTVSIPVRVRVPQGDGRSFGVELSTREAGPTFGGRVDGVSVTDGMPPVELTLRPYVTLSGAVWSVTDIPANRYDEMMAGEVTAYLFTEQKSGGTSAPKYEIFQAAAAAVDEDATFSGLLTPYSNAVFSKDGEPITYASVFVHAASENDFTGFCVPGTTESRGRGLEPGAKIEADLYMAARNRIGASSAALLSCVSPAAPEFDLEKGDVPALYLSFVTTNEPTYVTAILRGPPEFEARLDDRPEEGGGLTIPGLDVGFVENIESDLYMGFRSFDLYQLVYQFPEGAGFKVKLEIGFAGGSSDTTNEITFSLRKAVSQSRDGGTDAAAPDAGSDVKQEGRDTGP